MVHGPSAIGRGADRAPLIGDEIEGQEADNRDYDQGQNKLDWLWKRRPALFGKGIVFDWYRSHGACYQVALPTLKL